SKRRVEKHPAFGPRTFYRTRSSPGRSSRSTTSTTTNSSFLRPEVHQSLPRRPSKRPRKRSTGRRTSSARAGARRRQRRRRRSGVSALWLVLREEAVPLSRDFAAGLVLGLGAVVRQTTGLVALGLHGFRPTRLITMPAGAAIGLAPLLAYNDLAFGSPLEQGYGIKSFAIP